MCIEEKGKRLPNTFISSPFSNAAFTYALPLLKCKSNFLYGCTCLLRGYDNLKWKWYSILVIPGCTIQKYR